jgi:peptidoglycan/LPS O-acetylase OafA/YrhL
LTLKIRYHPQGPERGKKTHRRPRCGIGQGWSTLHGVIAAGLVSLVVATMLHYVVEVPGERWSRAKFARSQAAVI